MYTYILSNWQYICAFSCWLPSSGMVLLPIDAMTTSVPGHCLTYNFLYIIRTLLSCRHSGQTYLISQSTNANGTYVQSATRLIIYESLKFLQQPNARKLSLMLLNLASSVANSLLYEPRYEETGFLHMRKQRRRSASR